MIDVLHCADLGVSAHLIGNVFWEVISTKPWANTTEANVSELHKDLNEFTKKDTSRLQGKLTIERIRTTAEWPKAESKGGVHQAFVRVRTTSLNGLTAAAFTISGAKPCVNCSAASTRSSQTSTCSCQMTIAKNSKRWAANS